MGGGRWHHCAQHCQGNPVQTLAHLRRPLCEGRRAGVSQRVLRPASQHLAGPWLSCVLLLTARVPPFHGGSSVRASPQSPPRGLIGQNLSPPTQSPVCPSPAPKTWPHGRRGASANLRKTCILVKMGPFFQRVPLRVRAQPAPGGFCILNSGLVATKNRCPRRSSAPRPPEGPAWSG